MSILLKPIQRINPNDENKSKKWHPTQITQEQLGESEVAELIAEETTLNPSEALMAIRQLKKIVQRSLLDSKSVKLGNWGSFNVRLETTGEADVKSLTARNIKKVNINFSLGDELNAAMQKASFVWLNKLVAGQDGTDTSRTDPTDDETGDETGDTDNTSGGSDNSGTGDDSIG